MDKLECDKSASLSSAGAIVDKLEHDERSEDVVERAFLSFLNGRAMAATPPFAAFHMDDALPEREDLPDEPDFAMMVKDGRT
jgi:hypothetical protein